MQDLIPLDRRSGLQSTWVTPVRTVGFPATNPSKVHADERGDTTSDG